MLQKRGLAADEERMRLVAREAEAERVASSTRAASGEARTDGQVVLREPTPVELVWMEEFRIHLRAPGVDLTSVGDLSRLFDTYCAAWHQRTAAERWDPNYVITALGVALGDALVARGCATSEWLRWAVAEGQPTTTVAVRNDAVGRTIFPVDAVARRWISAEGQWMAGFVETASAPPRRWLSRRRADVLIP